MNKIKQLLKRYEEMSVVAKATIWFVVCQVMLKGIAFITTPIFTRLMTAEQYGQYNIYLSWLNIFTIITTFRLNYAVFNKGMNKYRDDRDTYTATMQSVTTLITIAVFLIYLIFHKWINELTELPTVIMMSIFAELLVMPAIEFWTVRMRYEYVYKPVVARMLIMAFLNASIGVVAVVLTEEKGYARIISSICINISFGIVLYVYNLRKSKQFLNKEYAKFAISFNLPLLLHYFSQYILDQFDRIMVQKLISMAAAGIYSVSYNLGLLLRVITQSLTNALSPWLYESLRKKETKKIDDTMFLVFILVAGCTIAMSCFAPEVMRILADEEYYEGVYVIPPVALGVFFTFMYTIFANVEFYYNKNKFSMYISGSAAALNVILNYFGIKMFGYIAAAYTTVICYILLSAGHYIYMEKSVRSSEGMKEVFEPKRLVILSVIVMVVGILVIFLYDYMIARYLVIAAICTAAYLNRSRIKAALQMIKKKPTNSEG